MLCLLAYHLVLYIYSMYIYVLLNINNLAYFVSIEWYYNCSSGSYQLDVNAREQIYDVVKCVAPLSVRYERWALAISLTHFERIGFRIQKKNEINEIIRIYLYISIHKPFISFILRFLYFVLLFFRQISYENNFFWKHFHIFVCCYWNLQIETCCAPNVRVAELHF